MSGAEYCYCPNCGNKRAEFFYDTKNELDSFFQCHRCGMTAKMVFTFETSLTALNQRRKEGGLKPAKRLYPQKFKRS